MRPTQNWKCVIL
jgi:hypothetical protein